MKNILKIFVVLAIIALLVVIYYFYRSHSIDQEQRYLFSIDLIRSLKSCMESREGNIGRDKLKNLETIYIGRERLIKAKSSINGWKNSKNKYIRELSVNFSQGIDELILAQNLWEKIFKGTSTDKNSDIALATAKLQSGREKIFENSLDLLLIISSKKRYETEDKPVKFYLSKEQLKSIVQYINSNFEKEFNDYKEKKNQKKQGEIENYILPQEVWAAIFLKNFIEKGMNL